jgi:hypothetical protein
LTASHLLDFLLLRAPRGGAFGLGRGLFARRAFKLLAFSFVFDLCGVGQVNLLPSNIFKDPADEASATFYGNRETGWEKDADNDGIVARRKRAASLPPFLFRTGCFR